MKLLLDTHVFLAIADLGSVKLPDEMLSAMTHASAQLYVSVASLWEIAIKTRLGKLELGLHPAELIDLCTAASATILPIEAQHVLVDLTPEPRTRDPFDRLLLAQAHIGQMHLVTLDQALVGHALAWRARA